MSSSSKATFVIEEGKQEILMQREIPAPPDAVYRAYTDPKLVPHWWGPRRLTTEVEQLEARRGGEWRIIHREKDAGPNGPKYGFRGVYHEADPGKRIVRTFEFDGAPGNVLLETTEFEPIDGGKKTLIRARSVFETLAARDGMVKAGMQGGASESMDRLEDLLLSK
jgi:uncharacterized protein YndB with AHSA1/START domain